MSMSFFALPVPARGGACRLFEPDRCGGHFPPPRPFALGCRASPFSSFVGTYWAPQPNRNHPLCRRLGLPLDEIIKIEELNAEIPYIRILQAPETAGKGAV